MMSRRCVGLLVGAVACLASAKAYAGPVEQLNGISINPADPSKLVVPYRYGGNGMFISQDGGKSFGWLCSAGASTDAVNRNGKVFMSGDGSIYLGLFDGLLRGQDTGCGFMPVAELDKKYIADVTGDPIDPKRTYIVTTNPMADNGIYMNDGVSGMFMPFGTTVQEFINTLHVVKNGMGRRFYETGVQTDTATNEVKYFVRMSDDDGMTWSDEPYDLAQFGPMDMYAEFSVLAVDPSNPDHVLGRVRRDRDVDSLVFSMEKGKAGSWQLLAEPTEVEAATYTPEGVLYFGDSDQTTKSLYVVPKAGDMPTKITDTWRVLCLGYDETNKRMYGCSNFYLFGTVDTMSGELKPLLDLRCAENFVECPGQMETSAVCQPQAMADFCNLSHWVLAPVCDAYDRGPDLASYQASQTIMCVDGLGVPKEEGASSASAAGAGAAGMSAAAGSSSTGAAGASAAVCTSQNASGCTAGVSGGAVASGSAGAAAPSATTTTASAASAPAKSGGCSVSSRSPASNLPNLLSFLGALGLFAGLGRRCRR